MPSTHWKIGVVKLSPLSEKASRVRDVSSLAKPGQETLRVTGIDGVHEAGSSRGPCNVQTTNHGCDGEERGDEAEEEHDEAMVALPMTCRTLATLQPRLNLASTASLRLTARCTSNMGCLRAPPLRGRLPQQMHTLAPTSRCAGVPTTRMVVRCQSR